MATGITLDDLLGTMKKAGIPMNTMSAEPVYKNQSDRMMASRGQIEGAVRGTPPDQEKYRQEYMAKIAKIAEMDQKLAGVYGDPNSNLFIEHAGQRENAIFGARPAMEANTGTVIDKYNQDIEAFNRAEQEKLAQATQAYDDLIAQQREGERQKSNAVGEAINFDELIASIAEGDTNEEGFNFDDFISSLME